MVISVLLTLSTLALGVVSIIKEKVPITGTIAAAAALAQAGAMSVGLTIFTGKTHELYDSYTGLSHVMHGSNIGFNMHPDMFSSVCSFTLMNASAVCRYRNHAGDIYYCASSNKYNFMTS